MYDWFNKILSKVFYKTSKKLSDNERYPIDEDTVMDWLDSVIDSDKSELSEEYREALADDVVGFESTCSICRRIVGGDNDETKDCTKPDCPFRNSFEGDDD